MNIECYLSPGCGSEQQLRENIKTALALEHVDAEAAFYRIQDEEASRLGLRGSPSVLIDGQDIDPQEQLTGFS